MREFRPSWLLRGAVLGALLLWLSVGVLALRTPEVEGQTLASIAFFVAFFLIFVAYYFSMAIVVDPSGLTCRGATERVHFGWDDILGVELVDLPLGGYYVTTSQGGFILSSFIKGHRALVDLIVRNAGLMPLP